MQACALYGTQLTRYAIYMVGVDEVGRGCLAGPLLVVAARAGSKLPDGLKDSKLMSRRQREEILNLLSICCQFGEGWVEPLEIDSRLGCGPKAGRARALAALKAEPYRRNHSRWPH